MKLSSSEIRFRICKKLVRHRYWGGKHISSEDILKGFPSHLKKDFKNEIDELVRENILLTKPTSYGTRYSLDPGMKEEVTRILSELGEIYD